VSARCVAWGRRERTARVRALPPEGNASRRPQPHPTLPPPRDRSGSFAVVKKCTHRKDNSVWAVKCIDKSKLDKEDEDALKTEVEILERVRHPNIVKMRQVFDTPKVFYMVMEIMTGGELFDRIVQVSQTVGREGRYPLGIL
jgi:serine/threonine protein kinase